MGTSGCQQTANPAILTPNGRIRCGPVKREAVEAAEHVLAGMAKQNNTCPMYWLWARRHCSLEQRDTSDACIRLPQPSHLQCRGQALGRSGGPQPPAMRPVLNATQQLLVFLLGCFFWNRPEPGAFSVIWECNTVNALAISPFAIASVNCLCSTNDLETWSPFNPSRFRIASMRDENVALARSR